jgi:hypothetical protein
MTTLAPLTWKALPIYQPTSDISTPAAFLTSVKTALEQTNYADGTTRTLGSGVAWTPTTASDGTLICTPASSSLGLKVLFSEYTASKTNQKVATTLQAGTVMNSSTNGYVNYVSLILNGDYTATNVLEPVSAGGRFFGWSYGHWPYYSSYCTLNIFESQDALVIVGNGNSGYGEPLIAGGFFDPRVDSSITSSAEIDGKVYGVMTPGYKAYTNYDFWSSNTNSFMSNSTTVNAQTAGIFLPNSASNIAPIQKTGLASIGLYNTTYVKCYTSGSSLANIPVHICTIGVSGNYVGSLREISMIDPSLTGNSIYDASGSLVGYVAGLNFSNNYGSSFLLKA